MNNKHNQLTKIFSRIIAGTMTWGSWGRNFSRQEMDRLMHHCIELGITTFDHADIYGGYNNEAAFGAAFRESGIPRDSVQLISKCGIQYVCEARPNKIKHYDYSKEYIVRSAEQSLGNLHTDYLDLFLLHRPSPLMHPAEIAEAIAKLQKEGKILHFGLSNFSPSQVALIESAIPVSGNQVEISLTADSAMYNGILDDCLASGRMAMAWSPLGSYFREESERNSRIRSTMELLMPKYQASELTLLLAWLMKHPARIFPVVGTTNRERLSECVEAASLDLELEDWFELLAASQGHKVP